MRSIDLPRHAQAQRLRKMAPKAERLLWSRLRDRQLGGYKFLRQPAIGPYFPDFACREQFLLIEVDGATHSSDAEKIRDATRDHFLQAQGYRILRVQNGDIYESLDGVCEYILAALEGRVRINGRAR